VLLHAGGCLRWLVVSLRERFSRAADPRESQIERGVAQTPAQELVTEGADATVQLTEGPRRWPWSGMQDCQRERRLCSGC
jgi:hypothetical protein